MSSDQKLDKFAGTSRHWIHFDEEPPKAIWQECLARLVDTNGDYWITMTPIEGMTYIYDEMYEPNVDKPDGKVLVIEVNTMQNPYLTEEGIQGLVDSIDADEAQTRIGGAFIQQGGRIYKNFDPVTGSRHVLSESIRDPATFFPRDRWMWILALDHGLNNPTAALWIAVNDDGFCVVFDEWYKAELTIDQHAEVIKRKIREHKRFPDLLVGDPAMKQRSGITKTNIIEEYQKYGLSFMAGNNDVKAGLVRVKKYFNPSTYPGAPGNTRHPLYGGSYKLYFATDDVVYRNPDNSGTIPRLLIDPRCVKLIWEAKRYRWKTYADKKKQFENNPYDEPHKKDDHAMDALRYAIMTRPDLAANDDELNEGKLRKAMDEHGDMMSAAANWDIADPRAILAAKDDGVQWMPGSPIPRETSWDYDEHMGSAF
jgi:phage terminase large subunit-like protein